MTLDNELQGHYRSVKLTDLRLEYHPTRLDLMVVLLMVRTVVLMVGSAVLLVGTIGPLILMRMIVGMIHSYMLTGSTLPVRPRLFANIKRCGAGALRRLGDFYLMDSRLSLDRMLCLLQDLRVGHLPLVDTRLGLDRPFRKLRFVLLAEHLRAPGSQCIEQLTWLALSGHSHGDACRADNEH